MFLKKVFLKNSDLLEKKKNRCTDTGRQKFNSYFFLRITRYIFNLKSSIFNIIPSKISEVRRSSLLPFINSKTLKPFPEPVKK